MNAVEQHWLDRGGRMMHDFIVMGWTAEELVVGVVVTCDDAHYCNNDVRHAIEGTACQALPQQYGALHQITGTWSDYVMPPHIEEEEL